MQLEIAPRRRVDQHQALGLDAPRPVEAGQSPFLRQLEIAQDGAGRRQLGPAERAEPVERGDAEGDAQAALGADAVEARVRQRRDGGTGLAAGAVELGQQPGRDQDLAGGQARECGRQLAPGDRFGGEGAGRDVDPGEAELGPARGQCRQPVAAPRVEQAVLGERAGGDDPDHVAPDQRLARPLAGLGGILQLLADRDLEALADQPMQVELGAVHGHAAHGDVLARMAAALGQRDVERGCCRDRILEEQLVEIAHAEEQEGIGMRLLERLELRDHRARARHSPWRRQAPSCCF